MGIRIVRLTRPLIALRAKHRHMRESSPSQTALPVQGHLRLKSRRDGSCSCAGYTPNPTQSICPFSPAKDFQEVVMKRLACSSFLSLVLHPIFLVALLFAALVPLTCGSAGAQDFRSTLTGEITDPSGAVVAGATVTAVNNASGTPYKAVTTGKGKFYIPYVLPGTYTVTAEARGFKTAVQERVLLQTSTTFNQGSRQKTDDRAR
jgi:hypothetical protein